MRAFAEAWPDPAIVQQLVAQIPWGHNVRIFRPRKDSPGTRVVLPANDCERLEPKYPRSSDRKRSLSSPGKGYYELRANASRPTIGARPPNYQGPIQLRFLKSQSGGERTRS